MHPWHVESSLDLLMLRIDQKILTDPLVLMQKPSYCWKMMTILVHREVHNYPLYKSLSSQLGSIVELHRFSTRMNIRVLSKTYHAIELLAFLRVMAPVTNRSRFAPLPFAVTTVEGFQTSAKCPFHLSLDPSCSVCALKLPNQTQNKRFPVFLEISTGAFIFTRE